MGLGRGGEVARPQSVLVLDDDKQFLAAVKRWNPRGIRISTAAVPAEAFERIRIAPPDLAIVDWFLGGGICGVDLIAPLRAMSPLLRVAITSARLNTARTVCAMRRGADTVIGKPFSLARVLDWVEHGPSKRDVEDAAIEPLEDLEYRHIALALAESAGSVRLAARRLDISRNRLKRKLG